MATSNASTSTFLLGTTSTSITPPIILRHSTTLPNPLPVSAALSNVPFSDDDIATSVLQSLLQSATSLGSTPPSSSNLVSAAGQQPGISAATGLPAGSFSKPTQAGSTPPLLMT